MGLTALGALIAIGLAYIAQSPRLMARMGLSGQRLDLRARTFTGFALALLVLAFGFFMAGVPLGSSPVTAESGAETTATPAAITDQSVGMAENEESASTAVSQTATTTVTNTRTTESTPATGAFGDPLGSSDATATIAESEAVAASSPDDNAASSPQPAPSRTPLPTATATPSPTPSPTATPTPTPTATATPTLTPTPIDGETAVLDTGGSTLWLRRSPGGQTLVVVNDGDIVILRPGHANQAGILWREVSTVDGEVGWLQEEFLDFNDED